MKRRMQIVVVILLALAILASSFIGYKSFSNLAHRAFTSDAVLVLEMVFKSEVEKNGVMTQDDIRQIARHLHDASVINLHFDDKGHPLDDWLIPLQINLDNGRVVSAGPDRRFQTSDDIAARLP
jgi:hypothetical protein